MNLANPEEGVKLIPKKKDRGVKTPYIPNTPWKFNIHPGRPTWNLRIHPCKRKNIFQGSSFSGSMLIFGGVAPEKWSEWKRIPFFWGEGVLLKLHLSHFSRWCHGPDLHWRFWSRLGFSWKSHWGVHRVFGIFLMPTEKRWLIENVKVF